MKKVVIVGKGRGWERAPMDGYTWGITQVCLRRPVQVAIDMNVYEDGRWGEQELREAKIARSLCRAQGIPYICLDNYPIDEIMEAFDTDYFSNTFDYAIALAVHRGFEEIEIYGASMEVDTEYAYQVPGFNFWCGIAKGRGVNLTVHEPTTVMKTRDGLMYGYDRPQGSRNVRRKEPGQPAFIRGYA